MVLSRDLRPKLQQFTVNARRTRRGILGDPLQDELAQFPLDALAANLMARTPSPVISKSFPVPPHHGFRCDDHQRILPLQEGCWRRTRFSSKDFDVNKNSGGPDLRKASAGGTRSDLYQTAGFRTETQGIEITARRSFGEGHQIHSAAGNWISRARVVGVGGLHHRYERRAA
jgi:hypothetical protein